MSWLTNQDFTNVRKIAESNWIPRVTQDDDDVIIMFVGDTGAGKSALATQIGCFISEKIGTKFTVADNIHYDLPSMINAVRDSPAGTVHILDEAILLGHSKRAMSKISITLEQLFNICRSRNQIIFVVLPKFFDLMKGLRERTSSCIYVRKVGRKRGTFWVYPAKHYFRKVKYDKINGRTNYLPPTDNLGFGTFRDPEITIPEIWKDYKKKKDRDALGKLADDLPQENILDKYVKAREVSKLVDRGYKYIYQLGRKGAFKVKKIGGINYYHRDEVLKYFNF